MYKLNEKTLENAQQSKLDSLQQKVNHETSFSAKVSKAQTLWDSKSSSQEGKKVFEVITQTLSEMCLSVKTCNYCEQNEANDIEHIFPKSFFPEKAFIWENYLLACKQCNSGYKLDKCFVIDDKDNIIFVERGTEPAHKTMAFIDPRTEDPNHFLLLNTQTWTFEIKDSLSKTNQHKAEKTLEILQLNDRDYLKEGRKSTANRLYNLLERLARINEAQSIQEIENILAPDDDIIDTSLSIQEIKEKALIQMQKVVQSTSHPSVWYAIKSVSSKVNPKWKRIFDVLPMLNNW